MHKGTKRPGGGLISDVRGHFSDRDVVLGAVVGGPGLGEHIKPISLSGRQVGRHPFIVYKVFRQLATPKEHWRLPSGPKFLLVSLWDLSLKTQ